MNCVFKFCIYFCIVEINKDRKEISWKKTDKAWQKFNMKLTKFIEGSLCVEFRSQRLLHWREYVFIKLRGPQSLKLKIRHLKILNLGRF